MYFELHITVAPKKQEYKSAKHLIEVLGWSYSKIEGDIVLGKGTKEYATMHAACPAFTKKEVIVKMNETAAAIQYAGFNVVRCKVEVVVYDTKEN